jgi:tetratricopeptide (TPR) repeat protein
MKKLNEILSEKINLIQTQFLNDSQLSEFLIELETKVSSTTSLHSNSSIEQRRFVDLVVTFAKEKLEVESYNKFLIEVAKVLAESESINLAQEILINSISEVQPDIAYAESLLVLADIFIRKAYWNNSITLIDQAKEIFEMLDNKIGLAKCENLYGTLYGERGDLLLSKEHFEKGLDKLKTGINEQLSAELETNLAIIENICGNLDKSKEHFYKGLRKFESLDQKKRIAELQHNIGMLYFEMKDYSKAVDEFNKGIAIAANENYKTILTISYLAKANALLNLNKYGDSSEYCNKAMDSAIKIDDKLTIADAYRIAGVIDKKSDNYNSAENNLKISIRLNEELGNKLNAAESAFEIGLLYNDLGNNKQKNHWLEKSLNYYLEIDASEKVKIIEELLEPELN